jgi:hypothetical protein
MRKKIEKEEIKSKASMVFTPVEWLRWLIRDFQFAAFPVREISRRF